MLKQKIANILVWIIVVLSVVLGTWFRLININNTGFFFDTVTTQYEWGKMIFQNGVLHAWFDFTGYIDYPPLNWLYLSTVYGVSAWFGGSALAFVEVLKTWYIVCDFLIIGLLYFIFSQFKLVWWKKALVLSAFFVYPGFWFVSGVWGQSDTFHTLLILLSIVLLYQNKSWKWMLGGLVFALAFWFKLQVILIAFALVVVWLSTYKKDMWLQWKKMLFTSIPFLAAAGLGIHHLAAVYGKYLLTNQRFVHKDFFGIDTFISALSITLVFVYFAFSFLHLSRIKNQLQHVHSFLSVFFATSSLITLVFASLNPLQWYRTIWEPLGIGKGGNFTGAANLNNVVLRWNDFQNLGPWLEVLKLGSVLLFIVLIIVVLSSIYKRGKDNLLSVLLAISAIVLIYYVFGTGRVHSRYGHSALIILFIIMPFLRLSWLQWLGMVGVLIMYAVNQIGVYTSFANNFQNDFLRWIAAQPPLNNYWLTAGIMFFVTLVFLPGLIKKNALYEFGKK